MDRHAVKLLAVVMAVGIGTLFLIRAPQQASPISVSSAADTVFNASDPACSGRPVARNWSSSSTMPDSAA